MEIERCVCGHWKEDHIRVVLNQYKNTKKVLAVIDKTKKPKTFLECNYCGCENFKSRRKRRKGMVCPTCRQDMTEPPHRGLNNKDCPQCGQGLKWRKVRKIKSNLPHPR